MKWTRVTHVENIPVREGRSIKLGNYVVAIFNLGSSFRAVENSCPHRGGPLADGIVAGNDIVCPLHNWRISLESGEVCNQPSAAGTCVRTFDAKVVDGVVMVCIPDSPPFEGGVAAPSTKCREATLAGADGVVRLTTPAAIAATPPSKGGD